jgi:hypothetical protein
VADEQQKAFSLFECPHISAMTVESLRASKISVTVVRDDATVKYGLGLEEMVVVEDNGGKKNYHLVSDPKTKVFIDVLAENGLLYNSPLQVGDVLKSVNQKVMSKYQETVDYMVSLEGPVTMTVETPQGHPHLIHVYGRKPTPETKVGVQFKILHHAEHTLLQVKGLDSKGLLAGSILNAGDLVLTINGTPATYMSPEQATELLESSSVDTVNIMAMDPQAASSSIGGQIRFQRWIREARRVGVAVGGGVMLGVGLILVPTLPPPFGEALIFGGVSVLGTEFEAPKRVVRSARVSLEQVVGRIKDASAAPTLDNERCRNESKVEKGKIDALASDADPLVTSIGEANWTDMTFDGQTVNEIGETKETATFPIERTTNETESDAVKKTTMNDRFLSFGRNIILPFMDQVVGDREEQVKNGVSYEDNECADHIVTDENKKTVEACAEKDDSGTDETVQAIGDYNVHGHHQDNNIDDYLTKLIDDAIYGELELVEDTVGIP